MATAQNKLAFLNQAPPPGYVAGLGRGATGFTTRSDIGPARPSVKGRDGETTADGAGQEEDGEEDDDGRHEDAPDDQDPDNETGLFAGTVYEKDDEEADRIFAAVDEQMDSRRRRKREEREREERELRHKQNPKIQAQFADAKRDLVNVSEEEWLNLPEPGNLTGKRRKAASKREARDTRSFAIPDSILLGNRDRNAVETSIDTTNGAASVASNGATTSLVDIGQARNRIFSHRLDEVRDGTASVLAGTSSTIDPAGYLTQLSATNIKSAAQIDDNKKIRSLFKSVTQTNPNHAPGWIAAALAEQQAGRTVEARKKIEEGCKRCPKDEDVWLTRAHLDKQNAKVILAQAVYQAKLTNSVKIWLKAAELETETKRKKKVLQDALIYIPNSAKLWKERINLEESDVAVRELLQGALSEIPGNVEFWLALARLSEPQKVADVLSEARKAIPTSHEIWIAALRFMEQQGQVGLDQKGRPLQGSYGDSMDRLAKAAVAKLTEKGAVLTREEWLLEAEKAEEEGSARTSAALVKATLTLDIEEEDRRRVWTEEAKACTERGHPATARAILAETLLAFPHEQAIWTMAAQLEREHGTGPAVQALLERAVEHCPTSEDLWLLYAREQWRIERNLTAVRKVCERAYARNTGNEAIYLEAAQMEYEHGDAENRQAVGKLLQLARVEVNSARVWLKSACFERNEGHLEASVILLREAVQRFPTYWKFHIMLGQLLPLVEDVRAAQAALAQGCRQCPRAVPLWLAAAQLEEQQGVHPRARSILERARMANPTSVEVYDASASFEERQANPAQAKTLLAVGLQHCPTSGMLHAHEIWLDAPSARRTKVALALDKLRVDAHLFNLAARLFWNRAKIEEARKFLIRSVEADPDWGDGWAWWWKLEVDHGTEAEREVVLRRCRAAHPRHGQVWQPIAKDWHHPHRTIEEMLPIAASALQIIP